MESTAAPEAPRAVPGTSVPAGRSVAFRGLGGLACLLLGLEGLTGLALAFFYRPVPGLAHRDVTDLVEVSGFAFLRELHRYGSHALVIAVVLHLLWVLLGRRYRPPRDRDWRLGVLLLLLTFALAASGDLLPWSRQGYWGFWAAKTSVGAGPMTPGGTALLTSYALHVAALPAALALLTVVHLRRARRDREAPAGRDEAGAAPAPRRELDAGGG